MNHLKLMFVLSLLVSMIAPKAFAKLPDPKVTTSDIEITDQKTANPVPQKLELTVTSSLRQTPEENLDWITTLYDFEVTQNGKPILPIFGSAAVLGCTLFGGEEKNFVSPLLLKQKPIGWRVNTMKTCGARNSTYETIFIIPSRNQIFVQTLYGNDFQVVEKEDGLQVWWSYRELAGGHDAQSAAVQVTRLMEIKPNAEYQTFQFPKLPALKEWPEKAVPKFYVFPQLFSSAFVDQNSDLMKELLPTYSKEKDGGGMKAVGLPVEKADLEKLIQSVASNSQYYDAFSPSRSRKGAIPSY